MAASRRHLQARRAHGVGRQCAPQKNKRYVFTTE